MAPGAALMDARPGARTGATDRLCPICGGSELFDVCAHGDFSGARLWWCPPCQHAFAAPEPSLSELDLYYKDTYSQQRRRYFGEEYCVLMERRARAQISFVQAALSDAGSTHALRAWRAIDWGCGVGALVAMLEKMGVNAVGYDSDSEAIAVGQARWRAHVEVPAPDTLNASRGRFDLLTLSHVVEHLPRIHETLRSVIATVRPGGYVFIEVPNCSGLMRGVGVDLESHLQFFSQGSLTSLLGSLNVDVLRCATCGPGLEPARVHRATRIAKAMESSVRVALGHLRLTAKYSKTMYDGYYDYYPKETEGIWLRCVGRVASA
jgi:2-polyprenyl-3-methyl-5-hydroxy-6-metoxy-1,4-benzoquinol methylase